MTEKMTWGAVGSIGGFFMGAASLVCAMVVFVIADLITGVAAAKKRGEILRSRKLKRTVDKITWYALAIVLCHVLDGGILTFVDLHLAAFAAAIICGVELYSVLENAYSITGNRVFWLLTQFTTKKIEGATGVDIEKKAEE